MNLKEKEWKLVKSKKGLLHILNNGPQVNLKKTGRYVAYEKRLEELQTELIKLQDWVYDNNQKAVIIFEGRDAAGKGGAIRRFTEHLNPRKYRVVALPKPDEIERTQWYFQRYATQLPKEGEIVFFDRSWYNRAVVEPVNGFCSQEEYEVFMKHVNEFERMLLDSDTLFLKLYFSISKDEQARRFEDIKNNPLKRWKFSAVDAKAISLWDTYTEYKERMFAHTDTERAPWKIIRANKKTRARIEAIEYVLDKIPYEPKDSKVISHSEIEHELGTDNP